MEMTPQYMEETAKVLSAKGYQLKTSVPDYNDATIEATEFRLSKDSSVFVLESVTKAGITDYFLAIETHYDLSSTSFPLDSWKHFDDRVEFKYYVQPETSLGLSFVLRFQ